LNLVFTRINGVGLKKLLRWLFVSLLHSPITSCEPSPLTAAAGWGELAKNAG